MKKLTILILAGLFSLTIFSQNDPRIARTKTPVSQLPVALMPFQDNEALLAAEMVHRSPGVAPRFAQPIEVSISPATQGHWEVLGNGMAVWRLRIRSIGAKSLNLGFSKYLMPEDGSLVLYSPNYQTILGPFTPADNEEHEQLWTPVLPGEELVVEVQVPVHSQLALQLELKYVNHDFVGFADIASGSCNLDVVCGGADGWAIVDAYRDIIQSVAVISTGGDTFCTGFLVNNARQDCTPYFMTANHCGISGAAPSLVAYWNFQNSTCRQPNSPASGSDGNGQLNNFNTGSVLKATYSASDFTLVELDDPVSQTANAFFAGWSAEDFAPADTVIGIHHPNTEEKRISFEFQPTFIADYNSTTPNPSGTHITISDWDIGTTEGGSSGSPLFNRQKRVVGQLHGGFAACGNDLNDSYGWFYRSWTGGGTPATRLKDWLDPDNTGAIVLNGRSQAQCNFYVDGSPLNQSICAPVDLVYNITVSANFTGNVTLSVANLPAGLTASFAVNPVLPGATTTLTVSNTATLTEGNYSFQLEGTDGVESTSSNLMFSVAAQTPASIPLIFPPDLAVGMALTPNYSWVDFPNTEYTIEIATDTDFTNIVETATGIATGNYATTVPLAPLQTYFWRVRGENICGFGDWPASPNSFTTGAIICGALASANVPLNIPSTGAPTITSTLTVQAAGFVDDINLTNLNISHSWIADLDVSLTSPSGTTILLFSDPGNDACQSNDIQISLDDQATATYDDLQAMCNPSTPALQGSFQPQNPLSIFNGEPVAGTWTLTVHDDTNQDGGSLLNWGLDICSTIPNDYSITASGNLFTSCTNSDLNFNIQLGTAFDGTTGVTLSAENLPPGATATFSPNPATPGAQVAVSISNVAVPGNYTFNVVGTDQLGNSGSVSIQWNLLGSTAPPTAISPLPGATNVPLNTVIAWSGTGGGSLVLALDSSMTNIILDIETLSSSASVNNLQPCTTYYWTATAFGQCGESAPSTPFSFTTLDDLTFNTNPTAVQVCPTGDTNISLLIGQCFEASGVALSSAGLPAGAALSFIQNPAPVGSNQPMTLSLNNVAPGAYTVTITGNDGVNNVVETFVLNVAAPAGVPLLIMPANLATNISVSTAFDWNSVAGAVEYHFQLALDDGFTNLVEDLMLVQTNYSLTTPLNVNTTYYWRVTALNSCGQGTEPSPFVFVTWPVNSTNELHSLTASILPNPTNGLVSAVFSNPTIESIDASLFSVNGILLKKQLVQIGSKSTTFDLSALPSGVYLLQFKAGSAVLIEKIIVEK